MFKKLLIASAVLAVSSSVLAAPSYKGEYKGEAPMPAPCPTYTYTTGPYVGLSVGTRTNVSGSPVAYRGIDGTLSAGYGAMLDPMWYLAGEIFGNGSATMKDYKTTDGSGNGAKSGWSYGASIIPGFMLTDHVLTYLRAGVVRTRFTDVSSNNTGWQLGLGGQTNVYQNWDVRGEYVYSQYNTVTNIGKVQADQFNLGVVYKFV